MIDKLYSKKFKLAFTSTQIWLSITYLIKNNQITKGEIENGKEV